MQDRPDTDLASVSVSCYGARPLLVWYAIYKDEPRDAHHTEERAPRSSVLKRFDDAATLGMHNGRAVKSMWLIDEAAEQEDVVRLYGRVPAEIRARHKAYLARTTATN